LTDCGSDYPHRQHYGCTGILVHKGVSVNAIHQHGREAGAFPIGDMLRSFDSDLVICKCGGE
jgi:hypothetical protein